MAFSRVWPKAAVQCGPYKNNGHMKTLFSNHVAKNILKNLENFQENILLIAFTLQ